LDDALTRVGLRTEIAWTPEERRELVKQSGAATRCRCLIAVGGDGTVSALINERPSVPLSIFPAGTENLLAQHFGLGRDPAALAAMIVAGSTVRVDVGCVLSRRFLLMAGFGFDGDIVTRHHQTRRSRSGRIKPTHRLAYVEPILRSSFSYQFPQITVRVDDAGAHEVLTGTTVMVFNVPRYALGLPFVPTAQDDDGWLDLVVFRKPGAFQALYYLWKVVLGTHLDEPGVFHRRIKKLYISADEPIPVQIDGDPGGFLRPEKDYGDPDYESSENQLDGARNERDGPVPARRLASPGLPASCSVEIRPSAIEMIAPATSPMRSARRAISGSAARENQTRRTG
jgi:diacylglycerol kinase family enzyme